MNDFECEMCESKENPRSNMWDEVCLYCNEMMLVANLDNIRNEIKNYESGLA